MKNQANITHIFLDHDVYKWLTQLAVLRVMQIKNTGKVELDENTSKLFLNGIKFAEILNKMLEQRNINVHNLSEALKNQQTPGIKLYNWNLLQDAFQKINLPLDNDIKNLIVQGDTEMINELLKDMLEVSQPTQTEESFDHIIKQKPPSRFGQKQLATTNDIQNDLNLENVDSKRPLNETTSLLDFLITGLSRHLSLKASQTASLLSNGNKYLAHILVKGVKGEFETLTNWLSDVYANLSRVFQFFESMDSNVGIFLSTIKPGLLSKEQDVTLWTLRVYGRVYFELAEMEMHQLGYEWFVREHGGLASTFLCMQRHTNLQSQICELYGQVARYNVIDFFTVQFKKELGDKCVEMFNNLMETMYAQKSLRDDLISYGIIQYWAQQGMKLSESDSIQLKMQGLQYLTLNWMLYPIQFEEDQNYPNQYLFYMKKATRDFSMRFFALNNLYRVLDKLATERNPYAAVLYKKLTFSLIENYADIEVREFMLNNFKYLIQKFSSIPIDILLEPYVKQVMMNDTLVNIPDMEMFKLLANHPKMKIRIAIILLDLLAKLYLNNIVMSHLSFGPIQVLMARFGESQLMSEYAFKLSKISLSLHFGSLKSRRTVTKVNDLSVLSVLQQHSNDHEILEGQKRAQIIELVKFIINLQIEELNEQIRPLLCHFQIELQKLRIKDKGIISLLNMFGDPESIVTLMQQQWDQEKEQQEEILRQSQLLIENEFNEQPTPQTNKTRNSKQSQQQDDPFMEMRQKEIEEEKQFLQQHGVGFKKRIVELERGKQPQNNNNNKKKKQAVDPKVLENIANIKIKKEEELLRKQQEEEEKKKKFEMLQKKAQLEILKRTKQPDKKDEIKVELIDIDELERMDIDSMQVSIKKHHKPIKYLFSKYSNTTNQASKKQYFNEFQEQNTQIQLSDLIRICRDYQINMSKDEIQGYVKAINQRYNDNYKQDNLDFDNFERFIIQLALKTETKVFARYPAGSALDQMILGFGQLAKQKNENSIIFLDPDNLTLDPDRDLIRDLNQQLLTQDIVVPIKFKKVTEKQFNLKYHYRPNALIGVAQSWLDCHEIVNEIIVDTFKSAIMEPYSEIKMVTKVKNKPQVEQVSKQLKEVPQKKVMNKALEDKLLKKQEEEQLRIDAEERRKRHQEKLKSEYLRKKKEKEEEEQIKKQEERQQQMEKIEKDKRYQELLRKEAEEKKLKLREFKEKMAEENRLKEQQQVEQQKVKQEQERKVREENQKKQKEEVKKLLEQKQKEFKDKEKQEKQKEIKQQEEMKEWKNNVETMLKEEQEQRQREKQMYLQINDLFQSEDVQQIYKQYDKQLQITYHSYLEYSDWKIENVDQEKDLLQFKGFTNFASQFNIYPAIITPEDAQLIFRSLSRERERQQQQINEKNGFTQQATKGMNFREFQQALLRISIKGQKYFDLLAEKYQKDMNTVDMIALKKSEKQQEEDTAIDKREDLYQQVDQTSSKTVQGLLYFLDLPEDKSELQSKLKALKLEYQKIAAQRDKKQVLQQKLGDDAMRVRNTSQRYKDQSKEKKKETSVKKNGSQDKLKSQKQNRNKSVNQKPPASKQSSRIESVKESDLQQQSPKKLNAVGPNGEQEQWQISQDK